MENEIYTVSVVDPDHLEIGLRYEYLGLFFRDPSYLHLSQPLQSPEYAYPVAGHISLIVKVRQPGTASFCSETGIPPDLRIFDLLRTVSEKSAQMMSILIDSSSMLLAFMSIHPGTLALSEGRFGE
ncbi:MAG: hypothetical protein MZV70_28405 [Desulfobacterales bacterium]|nr:hypothetical protein [Desulfobacterales bacterium]